MKSYYRTLRKKLNAIKYKVELWSLRRKHKWNEKEIVSFLHIGKTGGSAVKDSLTRGDGSFESTILLHPHEITLCDIPRGEKTIVFLRDPVSRFVSGFNSRKRQGAPRYCSPWTSEEAKAFGWFSTPNELAVALSSEDEVQRKRAEYSMKAIGHVKDHYWHWFKCEEYLFERKDDILFIGWQESLNSDFEKLKKKLGMPDDVCLPGNGVSAHRSPESMSVYLGKEAILNLKKWYGRDYELIEFIKANFAENFDG